MYLAKVRGTVVSTAKDERLNGFKLLVTQRLGANAELIGQPEVSIDTVGAGVGETVIVTKGSSARFAAARADAPIDATIVGIVDVVEIEGKEIVNAKK
jgi:ethanolamine utilization protein EutN